MSTSKQAGLAQAVMAATTMCPRIVNAVVRAAHGPRAGRRRALTEAQRLARELLTRLELTELLIGGPPEADDAQDPAA